MPVWKGNWKARVDQDFEVEADTEAEALALLEEEMTPFRVVELLDFEYTIEEVTDGGDG
jgi:hypothetical protein